MSKILVIGGAGYIGSHTVYDLIEKGYEVVVMDNLSTGYAEFVPSNVKLYVGDITKKDDLVDVFKTEKNIDVVMHFAALLVVPESVKKPLAYYYNNVEGVRLLLEVMNEFNVKNIVFSSTAAVYGIPKNGLCTEGDLTLPINPYGQTKLVCEKMIDDCFVAYGINYVIFRYFNVAGAHSNNKIGYLRKDPTHLIPLIIQSALGLRGQLKIYGNDYNTHDGTNVRDYIHVLDLAYAHVLGVDYLLANKTCNAIINLGSNKGFSVKEVIEEANKIIKVDYEYAPRREGDPDTLVAANTRAKVLLNWEPKLGLDKMITSELEFRKIKGV